MPINELETHPYLYMQIDDFNDTTRLSKYCKLIVGTFPIYEITSSQPIEQVGVLKRQNWIQAAFMQFFYGSRRNRFWELLSGCLNEPIPTNANEAINILNRNNFLITDIVYQTQRVEYSSSDAAIAQYKVLNCELINKIIKKADALKIIYFTSRTTKEWFCECVNIPFINIPVEITDINNKQFMLVVLIPPHGNGLRNPANLNFYLGNLALNEQELLRRAGYTVSYKRRYYYHYLNLKCDELIKIKNEING